MAVAKEDVHRFVDHNESAQECRHTPLKCSWEMSLIRKLRNVKHITICKWQCKAGRGWSYLVALSSVIVWSLNTELRSLWVTTTTTFWSLESSLTPTRSSEQVWPYYFLSSQGWLWAVSMDVKFPQLVF